jgi:hypothetical protein
MPSYRVGFTRCSECDVELVDDLPVEPPVPHEPDVELVVIRTYPSVIEADLAKNALGAAGIESMIRAEGAVRRNYLGLDLCGMLVCIFLLPCPDQRPHW